jgi:hypothetical protein
MRRINRKDDMRQASVQVNYADMTESMCKRSPEETEKDVRWNSETRQFEIYTPTQPGAEVGKKVCTAER